MNDTSYLISEAAKLAEVESHVLRYWEEELQLPIGRNEMGHRYYTRWDIQVFLSIKELKKKGHSLKEIKEMVPLLYKNAPAQVTSGTSPKPRTSPKSQNSHPDKKAVEQKDGKEEKGSVIVKAPEPVPPVSDKSQNRPARSKRQAKKQMLRQQQNRKQQERQMQEAQEKAEPKAVQPAAVEKKENHPRKAVIPEGIPAVPESFYQILEKLVATRLKESHPDEKRYKELDKTIRTHQESRRLIAATIQQTQNQKKRRFGKKK